MNRIAKSLIAATAGIAVLMGGAGTLAVWNGSDTVAFNAPISAGSLSLSAPTGGVWTDQTGTTLDLASFRISPGDTITYRTTVDLTANGHNLTGNIALAPASITAATTAAVDKTLARLLTQSATYTVNGIPGSTFAANDGTQSIEVAVSVQWPSGTSLDDNAAAKGKVNLSSLALTVTQS